MRHNSWHELDQLLEAIATRYGSTIFDHRCNKNWDTGQAICAEAYGPDWSKDKDFLRDNNLSAEEPVPIVGMVAAQKLAYGEVDWIGEKE